MSKIYKNIRKARKLLHLSQEYVAQCLELNPEDYAKIEDNKRKVSTKELDALCKLFGCTKEQISSELEVKGKDQREIENLLCFKERYKQIVIIGSEEEMDR